MHRHAGMQNSAFLKWENHVACKKNKTAPWISQDPLRASQAQRSLNPSAAVLQNVSITTIRQTDNLMESFPKPSALNHKHVRDQKFYLFFGSNWGQRWLDSHGPIAIAIKMQLKCVKQFWTRLAANGKQKGWRSLLPKLAESKEKLFAPGFCFWLFVSFRFSFKWGNTVQMW